MKCQWLLFLMSSQESGRQPLFAVVESFMALSRDGLALFLGVWRAEESASVPAGQGPMRF